MDGREGMTSRIHTHTPRMHTQVAHLVDKSVIQANTDNAGSVIKNVLSWAEGRKLCQKGQRVTVLHGSNVMDTADSALMSMQDI